jgi:hypothetical protein
MVKLALTGFPKDLPWWFFVICHGSVVPRVLNENGNWKCWVESVLAKQMVISNRMSSLVFCTIVFFFLSLPVMSLGDSSSSKLEFINNYPC